MTPFVLIHYDEIALKGQNRLFFEKTLAQNIKHASGLTPLLRHGYLYLPLKANSNPQTIACQLASLPGIASTSSALEIPADLNTIQETAFDLAQKNPSPTFRIQTTRIDKQFPQNSLKINRLLGQEICEKTAKKVSLTNPELTIYIEIHPQKAFLFTGKYLGPHGLPTNTTGRFLVLTSGGIDSPVAAAKIATRGGQISLVHFHSYPKTNRQSLQKVQQIGKALKKIQPRITIYNVPFLNLQLHLLKNCQQKFLILLYRRQMIKIASLLARRHRYQALVTGESLGQVASQTIENLRATQSATRLPILRPLIGTNKQDIVNFAKKINTYEISIKPHQDTCSLFASSHPATKARLQDLLQEEKKAPDLKNLRRQALQTIEIVKI